MDAKHLLSVGHVAGSVTVPVWGETPFRSLSLRELNRFDQLNKEDVSASLVYLVQTAVCDKHGKRLFGDDDAEAIADLPCDITLPLATAIAKRIGVSVESVEDAKKN